MKPQGTRWRTRRRVSRPAGCGAAISAGWRNTGSCQVAVYRRTPHWGRATEPAQVLALLRRLMGGVA